MAIGSENGVNPLDVLGFIGDSVLIYGGPSPYSAGLIFVDTWVLRTPSCDVLGTSLSLCYLLDFRSTGNPLPCSPGQFQYSGQCYTDSSYYCPPNPPPMMPCNSGAAVGAGGLCYVVVPPCQPGVVQVGQYCFFFPSGGNTVLRSILLTSAKVVFIASCQTTSVFTSWWDMNLNAGPRGRALVVPDITAMANLPANQPPKVPPQNQGFVDLVQGAVAYEAFVQTLAIPGNTTQTALNAANQAIANLYPTLNYSNSKSGQLPQVIYKIVGNTSVCPAGGCNLVQ